MQAALTALLALAAIGLVCWALKRQQKRNGLRDRQAAIRHLQTVIADLRIVDPQHPLLARLPSPVEDMAELAERLGMHPPLPEPMDEMIFADWVALQVAIATTEAIRNLPASNTVH